MRRVITLGAMLPMVALGADWELNPRVEAGYLFDDNYRLTAPGSEIEVQGPLLDAASRSCDPGSTIAPARPQIADSVLSHDDGSMISRRSEHSELKTPSTWPVLRFSVTTLPWYGGASPM